MNSHCEPTGRAKPSVCFRHVASQKAVLSCWATTLTCSENESSASAEVSGTGSAVLDSHQERLAAGAGGQQSARSARALEAARVTCSNRPAQK